MDVGEGHRRGRIIGLGRLRTGQRDGREKRQPAALPPYTSSSFQPP
ncbi:MAG: hypothetical protein MZV63_65360 [Marinilabiliales bacterium]|nr:hypothetical protein [Marinilabiliales bacterium]